MQRLIIAAAAVVVLAGCDEQSKQPLQDMAIYSGQVRPQDRVQVELIGQFRDDLAYYSKRGIYVITDRKTGAEYIGISGVGITEVSSHPAGKTIISDER